MKKGIIFDLDGTLWDAAEAVISAWNESFRKNGVRRVITKEEMTAQMGKVLEDIFASLFPDATKERCRQLICDCSKEEAEYLHHFGGRLYPGLEEVLRKLAGRYALFIVSNCQVGYIEAFLDSSGLRQWFKDWECAGRTGRPKGENIRLVLKRNALTKALYVGDTGWDQKAAEEAGIPFLHAAYGYGRAALGTPSIQSLEELPAMAHRLLD